MYCRGLSTYKADINDVISTFKFPWYCLLTRSSSNVFPTILELKSSRIKKKCPFDQSLRCRWSRRKRRIDRLIIEFHHFDGYDTTSFVSFRKLFVFCNNVSNKVDRDDVRVVPSSIHYLKFKFVVLKSPSYTYINIWYLISRIDLSPAVPAIRGAKKEIINICRARKRFLLSSSLSTNMQAILLA